MAPMVRPLLPGVGSRTPNATRLGRQTASVPRENFSDTRQGVGAFVAAAAQKIGTGYLALQEEIKKNTDNAFSTEAQTSLQTFSFDAMTRAKNDVTGLRADSKWAKGMNDALAAETAKIRESEIYKDMETARKIAFEKVLQVTEQGHASNVLVHQLEQSKKAHADSLAGRVHASGQAFMVQPDPLSAAMELQTFANAIVASAKHAEVYSDEGVQEAVVKGTGEMVLAKVQAILDSADSGRVTRARRTISMLRTVDIDGNKVQIDEANYQAAQSLIKSEGLVEQGRNLGTELYGANSESLSAALSAVDEENAPPEVAAEATRIIKERFAAAKVDEANREENAYDAAFAKAQKGIVDASSRAAAQSHSELAALYSTAEVAKARLQAEKENRPFVETPSDTAARRHWDGMTPAARSAKTWQEWIQFYDQPLNGMWMNETDRNAMVKEWRADALGVATTFTTLQAGDDKTQQTQQAAAFKNELELLDVELGVPGAKTSSSDGVLSSVMRGKLRVEFEELNQLGVKITREEMQQMMRTAATKVEIGSTDLMAIFSSHPSVTGVELKDFEKSLRFTEEQIEDKDPKLARVSNILGIPPRDRFDFWHNFLSNRAVTDKDVTLLEFDDWIAGQKESTRNPASALYLTPKRANRYAEQLGERGLPSEPEDVVMWWLMMVYSGG